MVNVSVFCPIERICSLLSERGFKNGYETFGFQVEGFGSWSGPCLHTFNKAMGVSDPIRKQFLTSRKIEGLVTFGNKTKVITKKVVIEHCLLTDEPFSNETSNGTIASRRVCYPEARSYTASLTPKYDEVSTEALRTCFAYIIVDVDPDIVIYGPKTSTNTKIGEIQVLTGDGQNSDKTRRINVFIEGPAVQPRIEASEAELPEVSYDHASLVLKVDGFKTPFILSQKPIVLSGYTLRWREVEDLVRLNCYLDLLSTFDDVAPQGYAKGTDFEVNLVRSGNILLIDPELQQFIASHCYGNARVDEVLKPYSFTEFGILHKQTSAFIASSTPNSACFALSLTYLFTLLGNNSMCEFLLVLDSLINQHVLKPVNSDGRTILVGDTAGFFKNTASVTIPNKNGISTTFELKRRDERNLFNLKGFCIIGFDPADSHFDGPDHYVVAFVDNEKAILVYDPYPTASLFHPGDVLVGIENSTDFVALCFANNDAKIASTGAVGVLA